VRETQINSLGVLENPKLNSVQSLDSSSLGEQATSLGKGSVSKSWNLQEQLMSDEIQQIYASRLHFQQKIK